MDQSAYFNVPGQPKASGGAPKSTSASSGFSAPSGGAQSCYMGVAGNKASPAASCYMPSPGYGGGYSNTSRPVTEVSIEGGSTMTALPGADMSGGSTMTALPGADMSGGSTMTALPGGFSGGSTMTAIGEMQPMSDDTKTAIGGFAPAPAPYAQQAMGAQSVYCGVKGPSSSPSYAAQRSAPAPANGGSVYFGSSSSGSTGMQSQYLGPK